VHRHAAWLDHQYELVAGAFSSNADTSRRSGAALGLDPDRVYADYAQMARAEAGRADGIEAVSIVTPNHMHAPVARAFLEAGIHVICDKPVTTNSDDARALQALAAERGLIFAVTHNYSAYPMVRQARAMVQEGRLGDIRVVQVEYVQDWLAEPLEQTGQKQAAWRTDPARAGGGAIGDIGSHAWHLADTIVGQPVESLCAQLNTFVPGRAIDDDVQVMLRYAGGARGMLWASQVAPGNENALKLRVYGEKAGIEWEQENPNAMWFSELGKPKTLLTRGGAISQPPAASMNVRIPGGHPEGYLEAFATLYSQFAEIIRGDGKAYAGLLPSLADGVEGVEFITASIASSKADGKWTKFSEV